MEDAETNAGLLVDQPELDLAGDRLETIWNLRIQEEAAKWTEEALCLQWLCPRSSPDWDWWSGLRQFERDAWLQDYRYGRDQVEHGGRMPVASILAADRQAKWEQTKALAHCWANDIRKAFRDGKPCPIIPAPVFEIALDLAIDLAGIPKECLMAAEPNSDDENEDITATAGAGHAVESVGEQASGLVLPQLIGDANRQTSCQDCPPTWPVNRAHGSRGG